MSEKDRAAADAAATPAASAEDRRMNRVPPTEPPKRRSWQIHLSTAVVLMFVAGSLLAFNFQPSPARHATLYGFPWTLVVVADEVPWIVVEQEAPVFYEPYVGGWRYGSLLANVFAAIVVMCAIALILEHLFEEVRRSRIIRRERSRLPEEPR